MTKNFIFYGIAGSGKGTQIKLLQEYLKNKDNKEVVYIYPGSEYRKIIVEDGYTNKLIKKIMDEGALVPDFLTNSILANILLKELTEDKHIITDGIPRSIKQSEAFEDAMKFYSRKEVHAIYIKLSKEEAVKRMKLRARSDDTDEGIARRFWEYENNVIPSMEYFRGKEGYIIHEINGEQSIEEVNKEIMEKLADYLK